MVGRTVGRMLFTAIARHAVLMILLAVSASPCDAVRGFAAGPLTHTRILRTLRVGVIIVEFDAPWGGHPRDFQVLVRSSHPHLKLIRQAAKQSIYLPAVEQFQRSTRPIARDAIRRRAKLLYSLLEYSVLCLHLSRLAKYFV
jgi:hypothetical protein